MKEPGALYKRYVYMDISSKDFSSGVIGWALAVGAATLFLLFPDTLNDAIDGFNLSIDYLAWLDIFWNGG